MHGHGLRSFLLLLLINPAAALTLTFPQSPLPQGQSVTVHLGFDTPPPRQFQLRLREIEPTSRIIDVQTVALNVVHLNPAGEDVTFNSGILEPGEYVAEAGTGDSSPAVYSSSSTLTVVAPPASTTTRQTSNGVTSSITTTPGSLSSPNSNPGSTPISVSGSTSIPASSTHASGSSATTTNTTQPAVFPTSSSFSDQLQSSELRPPSTSSVDSDPTEPPVTASSPNKRFNALPVVLAVVLGGLVLLGVVVLIVRCRRRRRFSPDTPSEPLPQVMDHRISESSFGGAERNRASQSLTVSSSPVSGWPPDEKVPLSLLINALATPAASGTSSASQLNSSSDRHEGPPEETSTASATSPMTTAPSPVLTSPASLVPSAAAHERLLEEVQWWRSQFASSWAVSDDTGSAGAPPRYPGSVAGTV